MDLDARCPECGEWSPVEYKLLDGTPCASTWSSLWWLDSDGCPECGYLALVETECDFRTAQKRAPRPGPLARAVTAVGIGVALLVALCVAGAAADADGWLDDPSGGRR